MRFKPHNYQQFAIDFIINNPIAAILLDMGMGKTAITLMAIQYLMYEAFEVNKTLVICPLRVTKTWRDEINKWEQLSGLTFSIVTGTATQRKKALMVDADIYIINRENLPWLVDKSGISFDFDMVVIDELSSFKNHQTARHKAMMKVRSKVQRIVGLTGTPASQGLMDCFAEFKVLDFGERLGRFIGQYRLNYFRPDRVNGNIVYSYKLLPGAEERIYEKISDITISMKAIDYLDMPDLISNEYPVELDEDEMAKYESLKKDLILSTPEHEVTASNAASLVNKLSQMANGAVYTDEEDWITFHDKKLDALEDIIESANGKPILVAYWFKHDYERIVARLEKICVTYMKIDSDESITKWNNKEIPVALIHPASAGHGLNLQQGGNTMVWFGITWSLELYQQCVCRLYRQGQSEGCVTIIHLISKGTIDEKILKALSEKDSTQASLIDAVKAEI
ncbi:MAG: DEAD/DEAH box helicase [Lachnospiraceae bacterium]|nr:DEAD/DEAH box helicase [Lachnospiraceae bacterium]